MFEFCDRSELSESVQYITIWLGFCFSDVVRRRPSSVSHKLPPSKKVRAYLILNESLSLAPPSWEALEPDEMIKVKSTKTVHQISKML